MHNMTETNLKSAFAGESQAHMRYGVFADIAEEEGFPNVAKLFSAAVFSEQVHATNHYKNLKHLKEGSVTVAMAAFGPRSTADNQDMAIDGETFEIEEMYPAYLAVAKFQGEKEAQKSITWAYTTEKVHQALYKKAKDAVINGEDVDMGDVIVCANCGMTFEGTAPDKCPQCGVGRDEYQIFS